MNKKQARFSGAGGGGVRGNEMEGVITAMLTYLNRCSPLKPSLNIYVFQWEIRIDTYSPPGKGKISTHLHVGEGGGIISEVKGNSQINFGRVRLELKPPNRHSGNDGTFSNTLLTDIYLFPLKDIENLKRSLHYAKHVLQADYENKLQERALDL